jgi:hypothetical protein
MNESMRWAASLFYPYFVVFVVLVTRDILFFWMSL